MTSCRWQADAGRLSYQSPTLEIRAQRDVGFTRLAVAGEAMLASPGEASAALAFAGAEGIADRFANARLTLSERHIERQAEVGDGVFVQRIDCRRTDELELYAGFNLSADHDLLLALAPEVRLVRIGRSDAHLASLAALDAAALDALPAAGPAGAGGADLPAGDLAVLVGPAGAWLEVRGPLRLGRVPWGDGTPVPALLLRCAGFAANAFALRAAAEPQPEHQLAPPRFAVTGGRPLETGEQPPAPGVPLAVFAAGEAMSIGIEAGPAGDQPVEAVAEVQCIHEDGRVLSGQSASLHVQPGRTQTAPTGALELGAAGAIDAWGRLSTPQGRLLWADRFRLLYDVEGYRPEDTRQDDHDAFWDRTLEEMNQRPLELREENRFTAGPWECIEVSYNVLAPRRVHAMLFLPGQTPGQLPVIVTAHPNIRGWGVEQGDIHGSSVQRDARFAWFVPLIRGHRPDAPDVPFNVPWWGPMQSRETYEGRYWYSTMARSLDALAAMGERLDLTRVAAKGGSQGGALALVTAALDPRVALCLADCPSHCQLQNVVRDYPLMNSRRGQFPPGMTPTQAEALLSYFDAANLCPRITCRTVVSHNVGDTTVHITGGLAAFKMLTQLSADRKWLMLGAGTAHANPSCGQRKMAELLDGLAAAGPEREDRTP